MSRKDLFFNNVKRSAPKFLRFVKVDTIPSKQLKGNLYSGTPAKVRMPFADQ